MKSEGVGSFSAQRRRGQYKVRREFGQACMRLLEIRQSRNSRRKSGACCRTNPACVFDVHWQYFAADVWTITGLPIRHSQETRMSDDKTKSGGQDRTRINTSEDYEVSYWTQQLGVTAERLNEAVAAVGTHVDDIQKYLKITRP